MITFIQTEFETDINGIIAALQQLSTEPFEEEEIRKVSAAAALRHNRNAISRQLPVSTNRDSATVNLLSSRRRI